MGVAHHHFIGAETKNHRFGVLPVAMQVQDCLVVTPQDLLEAGALAPGDRRPACHRLQQAVIVGGCQRHRQGRERLQHRWAGRAELADAAGQPPAELAPRRAAEAAGQVLGRPTSSSRSPEATWERRRSPQPEGKLEPSSASQ